MKAGIDFCLIMKHNVKKTKDEIIKKYGINGNKENTKLKSSKETNNKKGKCC